MSWLLDTNAISELAAKRPNAGFRAWFEARRMKDLFTSAVVLGELYRGIFRLPAAGQRHAALLQWIESTVTAGFADRIISLDADVARTWGQMTADLAAGIVVDARDAQIAATAVHHGHVLVTRNVRDMSRFSRLMIESPWT